MIHCNPMGVVMEKTAIIVLSHFYDDNIKNMVNRIRAEADPIYDVYLVLNIDGDVGAVLNDRPTCKDILICSKDRILALGYPKKCTLDDKGKWDFPGNADLLDLVFFQDYPMYDYYWGIEYDVHFVGSWDFLFKRFRESDADLLTTSLYPATLIAPDRFNMAPRLHDHTGRFLTQDEAVVCFMPIHRYSNKMLAALETAYKAGWAGHNETSNSTIAKDFSLKLEDIGGAGPYTQPRNKNSFYFNNMRRWDNSPGSFVFRPSFPTALNKRNTIWHPVKPQSDFRDHCPIAKKTSLFGRLKIAARRLIYFLVIQWWFLVRWRPAGPQP